MQLGTLLLRDAVITLAQLEAGLRAQILYGGRLGTNLVETGAIGIETLGRYLSRLLDVPLATKTRFAGADPALCSQLSPEIAARACAFPLGYHGGHGGTIAVAMASPRDSEAIRAVQGALGKDIAPHVAPELRIYYYLEKHYGIMRHARFLRTQEAAAGSGPAAERRRTQPSGGIELPPVVRFEPKAKNSASAGHEGEPETATSIDPTISFGGACDAIEGAERRDQIGEALAEYAAGRFDALVVFVVRDRNAVGWRGYSVTRPDISGDLASLSLALGGASALQACHDGGRPYRGKIESGAHPVEARLWAALGTDAPPAEVMVVPVAVKSRMVNLVYAHGPGGAPISEAHAEELCELCARAEIAYIRLIRAAKHR